jgi:PLP dependent protein
MNSIRQNVEIILKTIPEGVKLIAVTKTRPVFEIMQAYDSGLFRFGENRVQELLSKQAEITCPVDWHLIGHLQTNKVKSIIPVISLIQSVDSFRLLKEIDHEAEKAGKMISCLLQFHIAREDTKFGFSESECRQMLDDSSFTELKHVIIKGVMGMATFTQNTLQVASEFSSLRQVFDRLKLEYFVDSPAFHEVSMGMSGDYKIAIGEGSTMVRIGSSIFGERY